MAELLEDRTLEIPDSLERVRRFRFEPSPRRVRAVFANVTIADSRRVMLLHESKHLPSYYFPAEDIRTDLLLPTERRTHSPMMGEASYWSVQVGDRVAENAAWRYESPLPDGPDIKDYMAFYWNLMDAWYEEDDEVFVHPRDPYHRVDVLHSSRQVRVVMAGETVAETRRPRLLFETGLPTRYYIPKQDVHMELLESTEKTTACPYKGKATYWTVRVGNTVAKDIAWSYPFPIPECAKIENLIAFFNERTDIYVDGELIPKPRTPWS
jgi:uncharacterized protein (DUF427 family)